MSKRVPSGVTRPTDHTIPHDIIADLVSVNCDGCDDPAGDRSEADDLRRCIACDHGTARIIHLLAVEVEGLRAAADAISDIRFDHDTGSRDEYDRGLFRAADECCDAITDAYARIERRLEAGE